MAGTKLLLILLLFIDGVFVTLAVEKEGTCSSKKDDGGTCTAATDEKKDGSTAAPVEEKTLKVNANKHGELHLAVRTGNVEKIRELLNSNKDKAKLLSEYDGSQWGHTALHLAVVSGQLPILETLLDNGGADFIDLTNRQGETPLTVAATNGRVREAELLIKRGANLEKTGQYGRTPLHQAALNGQASVVELLLAKGADITAKDGERASNCLHLAASFGFEKIVATLLAAKPDLINVPNALGHTALHVAAWNDHADTVRFLVAKGANPSATDRNGDTPFALAHNSGRKNMVKLLQKLGIRK